MDVKGFNVNVCSERPAELIRFYKDVVGLTNIAQIGPRAVLAAGAAFLVDGHDGVRGHAKEPQRILLTFSVVDVVAEQNRLEAAGVTFVRPATKEPWGGYVATFTDPDGNYCQLSTAIGA
jgi:predicted enzyme related to lactoylglutathione lyase